MNHSRSEAFRRWSFVVMLAAMIVIASSRSRMAVPAIVDFDKLAHFAIFGLLATLVARAGFVGPRACWAVLIVSLFGLTDEWHQSFTPGREVDLFDWVADTLGAITAVVAYVYWPAYRRWLEQPLRRPKARIENRAKRVPNLR